MTQLPDFWETIRTKVQVYRNDVESLSQAGIHLEDGPVLPCDALLLGTGFRHEYPFFNLPQHIELGLSHPPTDTKDEAEWAQRTSEADQRLCTRFPILKDSPGYTSKPRVTPFRLYNAIAPISDQSVVFVGCISVVSMFLGAELQALWAVAHLDGNIALPPLEEQKNQIAMDNQWSRRRYPYYSATCGTIYDFEVVSYLDRLLKELGLSSHVQKSWWQYWTGRNDVDAYRGLMQEYLANRKKLE
jgi:dimethylaniline monooxygenase (N-oxide forming)